MAPCAQSSSPPFTRGNFRQRLHLRVKPEVPCAPTSIDFGFPLIQTTKLLVETRFHVMHMSKANLPIVLY